MKKLIILILFFALSSCNSLSDDFFSVLLNSNEVGLTRICEQNPSIFFEGRFIEQYELSPATEGAFIARFSENNSDSLDFPSIGSHYLERYKSNLTWRKTPVKSKDSVIFQVSDDVADESLGCYDITDIVRLLKMDGNYYSFFYSTSGMTVTNYKFYLIEPKTHTLYVLTSYP